MLRGLRNRAPELLFEGVLIVFAVLVALGVDEYRESREERQLAHSAVERIANEIRDNRAEIMGGREANRALLGDLGNAVTVLRSGGDLTLTGVNYEVALLGTDAWETARVTRAVHFIEFDDVSRISKAYRIQQLYQDRQDQIVGDIATIGGRENELESVFRSIRGGLAITLQMECDLIAEYDSLLVALSPSGSTTAPGTLPEGCE